MKPSIFFPLTIQAAVLDDGFDCRLRQLALDHAEAVVLEPWSSRRTQQALDLVSEGLNLAECADAVEATHAVRASSIVEDSLNAVEIFVSPEGDDSAAGDQATPLRTIAGAQARIRQRWAEPEQRPAITVRLRGGAYHDGKVSFSPEDSGASANEKIVYAAALDAESKEPEHVQITGGMDLAQLNLHWEAAASPAGAFVAKLPDSVSVPDVQDQLFLDGEPLVRARVPNGRPWIPLDGFNLTVGRNVTATHGRLPDIPEVFSSCGASPWPPAPKVPFGECGSALDNVNLVAGLAASHLADHVDDAEACHSICAEDSKCNFWTWHDENQGQWAKACYVRYDDIFHYEPNFSGHTSGVCNHTLPDKPAVSDFPCESATAVCKDTNATQWPLGRAGLMAYVGEESAKALGSTIEVEGCVKHIRTTNEWPIQWDAVSGFGLRDKDNASHVWINKLDHTHNLPLWYGPWAGGMAVDVTQDAGGLELDSISWSDPQNVVVHAMADGEWGGVQFRVADAPVDRTEDQAILKFQYGGWQQARGAMLYGDASEQRPGNRFYMEGSLDFLDEVGEWHFDESNRALYVFPPAGFDAATLSSKELLLTQTDRVFEFVGSDEKRVRNIGLVNLSLGFTSAQFFKPHEETSGGDYAVHRGAAVFAENAHNLTVQGNNFQHIGGNAVFLSNAVGDVHVASNMFRFIGTSGVSLVGRTGKAMGDGRDGEAIRERHGQALDNGVRLPRRNRIEHNVFADLGVWDKQSACYHKALTAPDNVFINNICFNTSRHAVNYQDSMSGGGAVEGNLFFNLNRETRDTSAFNSWGRRVYLLSDYESDPAKPRLVPKDFHSVKRNFILTRNYHAAGYQDNGDGLRCDDAANWYNFSDNVLYQANVEFNGGGQIYTQGNLFIRAGWALCQHLTEGGSSQDMFVDPSRTWRSICGDGNVDYFWADPDPQTGQRPANYHGDGNLVANSASTVDWSQVWGGLDLETWQNRTQQDAHSVEVRDSPDWAPEAVVERARRLLQPAAHEAHSHGETSVFV